ncbi:hypothetical protein Tco_1109001 [Tanacetum coccineum]
MVMMTVVVWWVAAVGEREGKNGAWPRVICNDILTNCSSRFATAALSLSETTAATVRDIWRKVSAMADIDHQGYDLTHIIQSLINAGNGNNIRSVIRRMAFSACVYNIWQERNGRIFKDAKRSGEEVFKCIVEVIKHKLLGITVKDSKAVKDVEAKWMVSCRRLVQNPLLIGLGRNWDGSGYVLLGRSLPYSVNGMAVPLLMMPELLCSTSHCGGRLNDLWNGIDYIWLLCFTVGISSLSDIESFVSEIGHLPSASDPAASDTECS